MYADLQSYINQENDKLAKKWNDFKLKVFELKNNLAGAREYFLLLETVENRYHQTYTFLVNSANLKKNDLKSSESAFELIDEIEKYVIENKQKQMDDLEKLAKVSKNVFGFDKTETLLSDNMFIFQSFEKIKSDIVDIVKDLKQKEDPISLINEIDKNVLIIESHEENLKIENSHEIVPVMENEPPRFVEPLADSEIDEGLKFKFECRVKGFPDPNIKWLKDGISVENNFDYKTAMQGGCCSLEIEETLTADSAKFTCKASNIAGTAETSAYLIVKESAAENFLSPPEFMKNLQNSTVKENSFCEMNCLISGNPLPNVQWFKNNECIDNSPDYNITYNNGNAVLKIENVKQCHQGKYLCRATNQAGINESVAFLNVDGINILTRFFYYRNYSINLNYSW
jgi:titin